MSEAGFRRMGLDALDAAAIKRLIEARESLFVERKLAIPADGLGPTVASFANTLGGWVLLGVSDGGEVEGFKLPGRVQAQDFIRETLRGSVDPMPAFVADVFEIEARPVVVLRVAESSDTPHITNTGVVFIREPGAKRPVDDHRTLLELARKGEEADAKARRRIVGLPLIEDAMRTPDRIPGDNPAYGEPLALEWIVRLAPLTVSGSLATRALAEPTTKQAEARCVDLFPTLGPNVPPPVVGLEAKARGIVAPGYSVVGSEVCDVAIDAGGVIAARRARRRRGGGLHLLGLAEQELNPLLSAVSALATYLDANGRALVELEARGIRDMPVHMGPSVAPLELDGFRAGGELAIPADEVDIASLAEAWCRELGREAGLPLWELGGDELTA